jgi:hypothetical protein
MAEKPPNGDLPERTSALESWKTGVDKSLSAIVDKLDHIEDSISRGNRTNWGVVFAGLALAGGLWAVAIRPLETGQDRIDNAARTLAEAVLRQDNRILRQETQSEVEKVTDAQFRKELDDIEKNGTPGSREAIQLMAYRIDRLEKCEPSPPKGVKP